MSEPLILKTNEKPTYFNKEAAIGFLIAPVVGGIAGAIIGKNRMEDEAKHGKIVKDPTFWNKDTLLGGLGGLLLGSTLGKIAAIMVVAANPFSAGAALLALTAIVGGAVFGTIAGTYVGGIAGQETMKNEQLQAYAQQVERTQQQGRTPQQQVNYGHDVSQDHAKKVLEERARTSQVQLA